MINWPVVFYVLLLQVCAQGMEHTGRWTRQEHDRFMAALKRFGKEWKKVGPKTIMCMTSFLFESI